MRVVVAFLVLAVIALLTLELSNESTQKLLFDSNGWIDEGTAFGVTVGDRREQAMAVLGERYALIESTSGNGNCTSTLDGSYLLHIYDDQSWRGGRICIVTASNEVTAVSWMFQVLPL